MKKETTYTQNVKIIREGNPRMKMITIYQDADEFKDNDGIMVYLAKKAVRRVISGNYETAVLIKSVIFTNENQVKIEALLVIGRNISDKIEEYE